MFNGRKMREFRKKKGLTSVVLGHKVGISDSYISMLETGKRGFPDGKLLFKISRALDCKPHDLTDDPMLLAFADSFARQASEPPKNPISRIVDQEFLDKVLNVHDEPATYGTGEPPDRKEFDALRKRVEMLEEAFKLIPKGVK